MRYRINNEWDKVRIFDNEWKFVHEFPRRLWNRDHQENITFCDVLESKNYHGNTSWKVRVSLPDGKIIVGWTNPAFDQQIAIHGHEELFDGRFNSDKVN